MYKALKHGVVDRPKLFFKEHGIGRKLKAIKFTFTVIVTLFDIISDIVLAADYFINGDIFWGLLTVLFIIFPLILIVMIPAVGCLLCCCCCWCIGKDF